MTEPRPLLTHALALLAGIVLALLWATPAEGALPRDRIVTALVSEPYAWRPDAARSLTRDVPAVVRSPYGGWSAYYCNVGVQNPIACPNGGPEVVVYSPEPSPYTLDHEYQHAYRNLVVRETEETVTGAFGRLARTETRAGLAARRVLAEYPDDTFHLFHHLIGLLRWDYGLVPEEHRGWYGYARIRRVLLPGVVR